MGSEAISNRREVERGERKSRIGKLGRWKMEDGKKRIERKNETTHGRKRCRRGGEEQERRRGRGKWREGKEVDKQKREMTEERKCRKGVVGVQGVEEEAKERAYLLREEEIQRRSEALCALSSTVSTL